MTGPGDRTDRRHARPRTRPAVLLALLAGLLSFLALGDAPERTRFWLAVFDAGHAPLFGLVALVVAQLIDGRAGGGGGSRVALAAFGVTAVMAAASEVLQVLQADREVSLADLLRDLAGAGAFLLVRAAVADKGRRDGPRLTARRRAVALMVASLVFGAALSELAVTSAVYLARRRAFPTLFALDGTWWEHHLIAPGRTRLTPGHTPPPGIEAAPGEPLARIDLQPGLYPGLAFDEPYPDWRGYRRLTFLVVSDLDVPLGLTLRVHDARHDHRYLDRFNRRLTINPGVNRIEVPLDAIRLGPEGREMDLGRVRGVMLFAYRLRQPVHFYLGPIRLE